MRPAFRPASTTVCSRRRGAGASLVELAIGLGVAALLVSLAMPSYRGWISRYEQTNDAGALLSALAIARAEAIKRGMRVDLCPSADGATCASTGRWEDGFIVFADPDGSGDRRAAEPLIRALPPAHRGVSIRGNRPVSDYVSFTDFGHARLVSGALQMGTFDVCRSGETMLQVVVANSGRARLQETKIRCP